MLDFIYIFEGKIFGRYIILLFWNLIKYSGNRIENWIEFFGCLKFRIILLIL